jgi:excisionase family DNA binding protein
VLRVSDEHRPPLDYQQAAEYLNTNPRHLRGLVSRREIPHVKLGRLVRFVPDQLDEWMRDKSRVSA